MTLRTAILSYLASYYPAAFSAEDIRYRVSRPGLLKSEPSIDDVTKELNALRSPFIGNLVDTIIDPVNQASFWGATQKGVDIWAKEGRKTVGN